MKIAIIFESV